MKKFSQIWKLSITSGDKEKIKGEKSSIIGVESKAKDEVD